jgi:hypothetical protein
MSLITSGATAEAADAGPSNGHDAPIVEWRTVLCNASSTEGVSSMIAERFNWKEITQLLGGVAVVALLQVGLLFLDTRDFVGSWVVMTLFGVIYAVIGGVTTSAFEKRRRSSTNE